MLHSYAAAAIVSYALRRFCDTIDLLVLKRNHYNKETKMRKSRTTLMEKTLFSVSVNASNHNELKLFPLVIRFFNAKVVVRVRLLNLRSMPNETSQQIMDFILTCLQENDLDVKRLTSFCADNAPVNFGESQMSGQNNVFYRLKQRAAQVIPVGCPAHILLNAAEKASDSLTIDIETIVLKIGSHFKSQTSRAVSLKKFCEQLDTNYSTLPTHTPT